ncbi:MAG: NAD(+)/NADH kinase [Deltaproteobacteria bacterium]|nr:NAD(+)/NADH kinase [Deltaproteobacteria bacterium]
MARGTAISAVGLCLKPNSAEAGAAARDLSAQLRRRGVAVLADKEAAQWCGCEPQPRGAMAERAELLIVLGGDGTLLSVARAIEERPVPILGVNLGTLGFLAEVNPGELPGVLDRVLAGDYATEPRLRLEVRAWRPGANAANGAGGANGADAAAEDGRELLRALALNDAVVTRGDLSRIIDLETWSDGVPLANYHGDGLIVATPTGSTAYTLSAGGPILMPGARACVVTPICPHTLSQRPIVLPDSATLEMAVRSREHTAQLTVDGQVGVALQAEDRVAVRAAASPAHFVVSPLRSRSHTAVLRAKLGWGGG